MKKAAPKKNKIDDEEEFEDEDEDEYEDEEEGGRDNESEESPSVRGELLEGVPTMEPGVGPEPAELELEQEPEPMPSRTRPVVINKAPQVTPQPKHLPKTTAFLKEFSLDTEVPIEKIAGKFSISPKAAANIVRYFCALYVAAEHQDDFPDTLLANYNNGVPKKDRLTEEEVKDLRGLVEKYGQIYIDIENKKNEPIVKLMREAIPSPSIRKMSNNNYNEQYAGTPQQLPPQTQAQMQQQQQRPNLTEETALLQYILAGAGVPEPVIYKFLDLFELKRNAIKQNPMELVPLLRISLPPQKAEEVFNLYMQAGPANVIGWGQPPNGYYQAMGMGQAQGQQTGQNPMTNLNPQMLQNMMQNPNPMAMMQFAKSMGNNGGMGGGMGGDSLSNMFLLMWMSDWMESKQDKRNDRTFSNAMTSTVMKKLDGGDNPMGAGGFNPMLMQTHAVEVKTGPDGQPFYRYEPLGMSKQNSDGQMYQNMLHTFVELAKMNNNGGNKDSNMMDKMWTWAMTKAERFSDPMEMAKMFREIGGALGSKSMSDVQFQILVEAGLIKKKEEREDKKEQRDFEREKLEAEKGDRMTEKYFEMISKGLENLAPTIEVLMHNRQGLSAQQPPQVIRQQQQQYQQQPAQVHYNQPVPDMPSQQQQQQHQHYHEQQAYEENMRRRQEYEQQQAAAQQQVQMQQPPVQPINIDAIDFYNTPPDQLDLIAQDANNKLGMLEKVRNKVLMEKSRRNMIQAKIQQQQQYQQAPPPSDDSILQTPEELEAAFEDDVRDVDPLQTPFRRGLDRNVNFNAPMMLSSDDNIEEKQQEQANKPRLDQESEQPDEIVELSPKEQAMEGQSVTKEDLGDDSQS